MPLYTYACAKCGGNVEHFNTVENHAKGPECCGSSMVQRIVPVNLGVVLGGGSFQGYKCPVTDQWVTSRQQRRNIMAEHNLVEAGDATKSSRDRHEKMMHATNGTGVSN